MSLRSRAILRMFHTVPVNIPAPGTVASADLRTSVCDCRVALALAMGKRCDLDGYVLEEPVQLALFGGAA